MKDEYKRELNENGELKYVLGFKYTYSTLMSYMKDDLIDLLRIAQDNYECVNERLYNVSKYAEKLDKALDRACEELTKQRSCHGDNFKLDNNGEIDCNIENHDCKKCWRDYLMKGEK